MNFVKCKAAKAARKVPTDFPEIKLAFLKRIVDCVQVHKIPPELIINWDQTGAKYVPTTLAEEVSRQIDVIGKEDKREMTVLLSCTMSGFLLPPHLIYCGKTNKWHPNIAFPPGWDIHHSENHWSTEATMLHFIDCVLVPYVPSKHCAWMRITSLLHFLTSLPHTGVKVFFKPWKNITSNAALYHLIARESFSHWILQPIKCSNRN